MFEGIKQMFCKHEWEYCTKKSKFHALNGEQIYKRCPKCKKVEKAYFRKYD